MPPSKIMVIRHAEKPDRISGAVGVREDGRHDADSLTVRGWQRAGALVTLFGASGAPAKSGLAAPNCVFASSPVFRVRANGRKRRFQCWSPSCAKTTHRWLRCLATKKGSELAMVGDVMKRTGVVLISWQHEFIPGIASIVLRNGSSCPRTWPGERFDLVWIFDRQDGGTWRFAQVPQLLQAGDRSDLIQ